MNVSQFRKLIEDRGKVVAVDHFQKCEDEHTANIFIYSHLQQLLNMDKYGAGALLIWGPDLFDPRPESVRRIWAGIQSSPKRFIMGAGSCGKSFSVIAWLSLDWVRDPEFTMVKIISTSEAHAKANTFSTLVNFHRSSIVPLPGFINNGFLGLSKDDQSSSISVVAIPKDDTGETKLKGFHPKPRSSEHPIFGKNTRVRAFVDESEGVPSGVWIGVYNMLGSMSGVDTVKVITAFNPKDSASKQAQLAMPVGGWERLNPDTDFEWKSAEGWDVTRLDGAQLENVKERREVYHSFLSYEGFRMFETLNGGNSPEYWSLARGLYPPEGVANSIISGELISKVRGHFVFDGPTSNYAGCDIAIDGRDTCVLTIGKFGFAREFTHHRYDTATGRMIQDRIVFSEPRRVLQVDQQIVLKKGSTEIVATAIRDTCIGMNIPPENLCIDATGNGSPVLGLLHAPSFWSSDVMGVDFSKPATDQKILDQDTKTPEEEFQGVVTEVWFALRRWMEFGYICFSPSMRQEPLCSELMGRKYKIVEGQKIRVQKKDEYVNAIIGRKSPDFADASTLILHSVRMRAGAKISATGQKEVHRRNPEKQRHGIVDDVSKAYLTFDDDGV